MNSHNFYTGRPFSFSNKFVWLAITFALSLTACSPSSTKNTINEPYYQSAHLMDVSHENSYTTTRVYIGQIASKQLAELSFEYAGKVKSTYVESGDNVAQGDILAELNIELLHIKMRELKAQITQTLAQKKLNEANLERFNSLASYGYTSRQQIDELSAERDVLSAKILGLNASIESLNYQISRSKLIAPFDGIIDKRMVAEGKMVSQGNPAFTLIKSDFDEINVGLPIEIARKLQLNENYIARIGKENTPIKLINIGKQIDPVLRTINARFILTKNIPHFNNQLVRININYETNSEGYWLPLTALTDGVRGQWNVYIAEKNTENTFKIVKATVSIKYADQQNAFVTGLPLTPQKIVAKGVHRYVAGQIIRKNNQRIANKTNSAVAVAKL